MKKFLAIILTLAMVLTMGVACFAEEAKAEAEATVTEPGKGPEMNRPNDTASVLKYTDIKARQYQFYEAETATLENGAKSNADHEGFHGTGAVAVTCWTGDPKATPGVKFTVKAIVEGAQDIYIGYDNGHAWTQTATLTVNGATQKISFPTVEKDNWKAYGMIKVNVTLNAGDNEIGIKLGEDDYPTSFNIDFVAVSKGDTWKDETKAIKLTIGNKTITKITENGETPVECDVAPMIKADLGLTFIPVRGVFEQAGATVEWNNDTRAATVKTSDATVIVTIDNKQARVNGKRTMMAGAAFIEDGRTFIPLRFISESLGYKVDWDGETQTITIHLFEE